MIERWTLDEIDELKENFRKRVGEAELEQAKAELVKLLSDPRHIVAFAYLVLPHYFFHPFKEVHYQALEFLEIGKRNKPNKAFKAYRGFGKTTIQWVLATIYESCYKVHKYVVVNSYNESMAIDKMKNIRDEFESNEMIRFLFGNPITDTSSWNKSDIVVFGDVRIKTMSTGQNPRGLLDQGTRPTKVISDDILDDEQVRSPDGRQKALDWYTKALLPALARDGVAEILNTPMHPEDIIETIFKKPPFFEEWDTLKIPALINGQSADPDWKTTEELEKLKRDEYTFSQEYMCEPVLTTSGIIAFDDLRFYEDWPRLKPNIYIHADTTHTGKQISDYFCIGAMAEGEDNNFYLLDYHLEKLTPEEQAKICINFFIKFRGLGNVKITFDAVSNDSFGYYAKLLAKQSGISLPLEAKKYPSDKVSHFRPHIDPFKANRVYLPKNHKQNKIALDQLLAFPFKGINDDFVDMLSGTMDNFLEKKKPGIKNENVFFMR